MGLRVLCSLVSATSARLRSAERGALMSALAFGTQLVPRAWAVLRRFQSAQAWPLVPVPGTRTGTRGPQSTSTSTAGAYTRPLVGSE